MALCAIQQQWQKFIKTILRAFQNLKWLDLNLCSPQHFDYSCIFLLKNNIVDGNIASNIKVTVNMFAVNFHSKRNIMSGFFTILEGD
jgi:hypothetical protein